MSDIRQNVAEGNFNETIDLSVEDESKIDLWWTWPRNGSWSPGDVPANTSWWWEGFTVSSKTHFRGVAQLAEIDADRANC